MDNAYAPMALPCITEFAPERITRLLPPTPNEEIPMLVHVDEHILEIITSTVGKEPWGVFAIAKATSTELWRHFRRYLVLKLPDGDKCQFRFYDPRLLPIYLYGCEDWELKKFFGPVRGFAIQNQEGMSLFQQPAVPESPLAQGHTDPNFSIVRYLRRS